MDPVTMALIGMQLAGGLMKANAARKAAQAQAAQDEYNARLSEAAAGDTLLRGQTQESAVKQLTSERISTGRAQLGASGVDVQSGSAVDTLAGQRARGALAALVVRGNAARSAWGYEAQASNFRAKAKYALEQGDDAALGALLGAGGQALGMAGQAGAFKSSALSTPGVTTPLIRVGEPTNPPPAFGDAGFGDFPFEDGALPS
ncbi:MAG TPA: hypothetical protein VGI97_00605 [Gemmatimonadaceae bacterium]